MLRLYEQKMEGVHAPPVDVDSVHDVAHWAAPRREVCSGLVVAHNAQSGLLRYARV